MMPVLSGAASVSFTLIKSFPTGSTAIGFPTLLSIVYVAGFIIVVLSMGSVKKTCTVSYGAITLTRKTPGPLLSAFEASTEFLRPGVPPSGFTDARQLSMPAQGLLGSTCSSDQPPSIFKGSWYH